MAKGKKSENQNSDGSQKWPAFGVVHCDDCQFGSACGIYVGHELDTAGRGRGIDQ